MQVFWALVNAWHDAPVVGGAALTVAVIVMWVTPLSVV